MVLKDSELGRGLKTPPSSTSDLVDWASLVIPFTEEKIAEFHGRVGNSSRRILLSLHTLYKNLKEIQGIDEEAFVDWIVQRRDHQTLVSPIWPSSYAKKYLFLNTRQVVLSTAWMPPGHIKRLGIDEKELTVDDIPSTFPGRRRPFYYVPSKQYNWKTFKSNDGVRSWAALQDQFIEPRVEQWKGAIHTSSYERARIMMGTSRFKSVMIGNHDAASMEEILHRFKEASPPCIYVGPSLFEGHNLPDSDARWQIISTVIWGNLGDPLVKARSDRDKQYLIETAAYTILQIAGRPVRSEEDWAETVMFDKGFARIWKYLKQHAPKAFRDVMTWREGMPRPLGEDIEEGGVDVGEKEIRVRAVTKTAGVDLAARQYAAVDEVGVENNSKQLYVIKPMDWRNA